MSTAKQQIKDSRDKLEQSIINSLTEFTRDTGLTVYDLDIELVPIAGLPMVYAIPDIDLKA